MHQTPTNIATQVKHFLSIPLMNIDKIQHLEGHAQVRRNMQQEHNDNISADNNEKCHNNNIKNDNDNCYNNDTTNDENNLATQQQQQQ